MTTPATPKGPKVLIVTGMSGAGRSTVGKVLQDLGYVLIDGLPLQLIDEAAHIHDVEEGTTHLAITVDGRTGLQLDDLAEALHTLRTHGLAPVVLFLDADDDVIAQRYDEVRRPHPGEGETVLDSVRSERSALAPLRELADIVIDTSDYNVHDLRRRIETEFSEPTAERMRVSIRSFGFKHGHPQDVDLMLDVRFLPNPHWVPELRPHTGLEPEVRDYVLGMADAAEFLRHVEELLGFLLPRYEAEGRAYLSIGVGCTGGRHRSVALAEALGEWARERGASVTVHHRDLTR